MKTVLVIVLAILAIATGLGSWSFWGGLGWGFGLVAIGVVLWLAPNLGRGAADRAAPIVTDQPTAWSTSATPTTPTATACQKEMPNPSTNEP